MKWEYQVSILVPSIAQEQLNQFGAEGWELVNVTSTGRQSEDQFAYLKRAKVDALRAERSRLAGTQQQVSVDRVNMPR